MTISQLHDIFLQCDGRITTDSRTLTGGELFFALKGENFDGNQFVAKALEDGAAYCVVTEGSDAALMRDDRIIAFPDTLKALQALATYHRENTLHNDGRIKMLALTGTNGKTTTSNLITSVLRSSGYTVTNNSFGFTTENITKFFTFMRCNFFTFTLGIGILIIPSTKFAKKDHEDIIVKITVALVMLIAILDRKDQYYETTYHVRVFGRTVVSVINYILRPGVIMLLGLAIAPSFTKKIWIYVPLALVVAIHTTSFYTDICVSFDEHNGFVRGPLGLTSAIITMLYLAIDIGIILWEHRGKAYEEMIPLLFVAIVGLIAGILELVGIRNLLNGGIVIGCLFYHIFTFRMRTKADLLTDLYNRQQLYSDIVKNKKNIKTIISIDMNGLKKLNDTKGHAAGDKALMTIGKVLKKNLSYKERAYRIGGDEFAVVAV